jgi:hypothetical protein
VGVVYLGGAERLYETEIDVQLDTLAWAQAQRRGTRHADSVAPVSGVEAIHLWNAVHGAGKKAEPTEVDAWLDGMEGA